MAQSGEVEKRRDRRNAQAEGYDAAIARAQSNREAQVRGALAAGATYLTLMSASATGRAADIDPDRLQAAQILLSLLFAGTLAYSLTNICNHAMAIADDGARRFELEEEDAAEEEGVGLAVVESRVYTHQPRSWRLKSRWRTWILAAIPRYGQSQRQALLFLPVVGILPAAWFSLTTRRIWTEDAAITALAAALIVIWVRLLFAGCRHWLYVHPRHLTLERKPSGWSAPAWGWWFYRWGARKTRLSRFFIERRERWLGLESTDPKE